MAQPTCKRLGPLPVPVGLPPVGVLLADDVQYVPPLEADAQLVARDVQVVVRRVGEVGPVVVLEQPVKSLTAGIHKMRYMCVLRKMKDHDKRKEQRRGAWPMAKSFPISTVP